MKTLYLTVGLPRSGKSTWAQKQHVPIVNPDSIRLAVHGQPFYAPAEPYVWTIAKTMVLSLFLAGHDQVILDATNATKSRREQWLSTEWKTRCVVFDTPADICLERAGENAGLVGVITRMSKDWQAPDMSEDWVIHQEISLHPR